MSEKIEVGIEFSLDDYKPMESISLRDVAETGLIAGRRGKISESVLCLWCREGRSLGGVIVRLPAVKTGVYSWRTMVSWVQEFNRKCLEVLNSPRLPVSDKEVAEEGRAATERLKKKLRKAS